MASALLHEEADDLVTCPVCLCEYDDVVESRKPKFLPCSHTLCVQCLKGIKKACSLMCPICRKVCTHFGDVSSLPNNSYAICILRMSKSKMPQAPMGKTPVKLVYCLACEAMSGPDCTLHHPTVDVAPNVLSSRGTLVALSQDLASLKDPLRSKVAKAIMEKKDIQTYLGEVSRALKAAKAEVDRLSEENDTMVAELSSLMESGLLADSKDDGIEDLLPLLKDCRPEDTLNTVKDKMRRSFQDRAKVIERKVDSCLAHKSSQLVFQQAKRRLSVQATDPKGAIEKVDLNVNWVAGVKSGLMANSKEHLLISHLVHAILERRVGVVLPALPSKPKIPEVVRRMRPESPPIGYIGGFISVESLPPALDRLVFVLTVKYHGVERGRVEFHSSEGHNLAFLSALAQGWGNAPASLRYTVDKAVPRTFVTLPLLLSHDLESKIRFVDGAVPRLPGDVGIFNMNAMMENRPLWSLFFTLNEFDGRSTTAQHRSTMKSAALVGRVSKGFDTLNVLSKLNKYERQWCKFSLEAF